MAKNYEYHEEFSKYPTSAIQAKSLGETYFYTGKKCTKGHLHLKYASSGNCVKCIEERRKTVEINFRGKSSKRNEENQKRAEEAIKNGYKTYIPNNPCPHGHFNRFVGSNNCVECSRITLEKRKIQNKWLRIKKIYGITQDDFIQMQKEQNFKCSICDTNLTQKNTHIDHCHKTNKVRSLLCSRCNQAIGLLDENIEKLEKTIKYLRIHNGVA